MARYAKSDIMEGTNMFFTLSFYHLSLDLAFSSELGSGEREVIHKVARKFGLRSKSYGKVCLLTITKYYLILIN